MVRNAGEEAFTEPKGYEIPHTPSISLGSVEDAALGVGWTFSAFRLFFSLLRRRGATFSSFVTLQGLSAYILIID